MNKNSPFYIVQDFLSPIMAEDIIDSLNFKTKDQDKNGKMLKSLYFSELTDEVIFERLKPLTPLLEKHYDFKYVGTEPMAYEYYANGYDNDELHAENSVHLKGKWLRTKSRDLTGIIFLSDYNETPPFSEDFEVYGGKVQFPQHNFSFNPERGTLLLFPSDPHFINGVSHIHMGNSVMVRFHIAASKPYLYDHTKFPGDYTEWFKEFA